MPLKILFLSHRFYPDIGGIETLSEILADRLSKAGHEVHLVTWSIDTTGKVFPFKIVRKPGKLKLLQEHTWSDLVFENNPCLRLAWPGLFFRHPSVIAIHTWISQVGNKVTWKERFKSKWLNRATQVVACSDAIRRRCWPAAVVVCNTYQEELFRVMPDIPRTLEFVFLGRLVSDKGVDIAISALHRLISKEGSQKKTGISRTLTIIGDGPELQNLQMMVSKLGIDDSVAFKGALRNEALVRCLNQHKFLLVPSSWEEPFGIVALEGMACGCIPIVSDGGGLPDAVGDAGLIFKRGDVGSLVDVIEKIGNEPGLEQQLKDAAPAHLSMHTQSIVFGQYLELFHRSVTSDN